MIVSSSPVPDSPNGNNRTVAQKKARSNNSTRRAPIADRRAGLERYLLGAPVNDWQRLFGLSEMALEFALKPIDVSAVIRELVAKGRIEAEPALLSGEHNEVGCCRVLPEGKRYLDTLPGDVVRPRFEHCYVSEVPLRESQVDRNSEAFLEAEASYRAATLESRA